MSLLNLHVHTCVSQIHNEHNNYKVTHNTLFDYSSILTCGRLSFLENSIAMVDSQRTNLYTTLKSLHYTVYFYY